MAADYLHRTLATYRSVVRYERRLIGYPVQPPDLIDTPAQEPDDKECEPDSEQPDPFHQAVIAHTLVWRFVGWLGSLQLALDKAREMILQQHPGSLCHRISGHVHPRKARSDHRLRTLETARQLLLIMPEWEDCLGHKFFPRFATRSGFS
jgi:hypothetical protein